MEQAYIGKGWRVSILKGRRRAHYYRDNRPLCGLVSYGTTVPAPTTVGIKCQRCLATLQREVQSWRN
jgi:hypothetical protein